MRYHIHGHFVEMQRAKFAVHHMIEKDVDTTDELKEILFNFTKDYHEEYCYGLAIGISEEPTFVD